VSSVARLWELALTIGEVFRRRLPQWFHGINWHLGRIAGIQELDVADPDERDWP